MKNKLSNKAFIGIWSGVLGFVLVLVIVATILCSTVFYGVLTTFFAGGEKVVQGNGETYYEKTAKNHDDAIAKSREFIKTVQGEGTVLLKNDGFLPMKGDEKLTLFGRDSVDFMYGGGGSGSLSASVKRATLKEALEADGGFKVNPTVWNLLDGLKSEFKRGSSSVGNLLSVGEIPLEKYTAEAKNSYAQYHDCAIVVFGRSGSEGVELYTGDGKTAHDLELGKDERDVLKEACDNFDNVVVIINCSATLELGFLNEYPQIRAALYTGFTGDTGLEVIDDILRGDINPSGHTVDTFAYDLTTAPSYANITADGFMYTNVPTKDGNYFIEYEEGIYVGYRWYETADATGFWASDYAKNKWGVNGYDDVVQFPFGYGLSYTEFDWSVANDGWTVDTAGGEISVNVTVTNKGKKAGKDVVQLYYSAPYNAEEGIEKSAVVLGGFAKTESIPAGGSDTVTISLKLEDMASYDYITEKAYVLSAGEYTLSLRTDAHNVKSGLTNTFNVANKIVYKDENGRQSDIQAAHNLFDDVSAHIKTYLSRADFAGTMPAAPTGGDFTAAQYVINGVKAFTYDTYKKADMPVTGASNDTELVELVGKDYDDPLWSKLLDKINVKDLVRLVSSGGYKTVKIDNIGKPPTTDPDGPGGFASFFTESIYGAGYCSEVVVAATWNEALALEMGQAVGEEGLQGGYAGWYAPAMNIHRSPFGGRNFEYYSEDGLLSGKMGAAVVKGCAEKGVYCYVKHFAVNDQDTKRHGLITWVNEQAMREIYFKPFEITVKEGKTTAVMSSFNRLGTVWAGGNYSLLTEVLRNEWGFKGMVITDYDAGEFMNVDQMLSAGGDIIMTTIGKNPSDTASAAAVAAMRNASKNILYTVVNSHAMNGVEKGVGIKTETPVWVIVMIIIDVVVSAGVAVGAFFVVRRALKNRKADA